MEASNREHVVSEQFIQQGDHFDSPIVCVGGGEDFKVSVVVLFVVFAVFGFCLDER